MHLPQGAAGEQVFSYQEGGYAHTTSQILALVHWATGWKALIITTWEKTNTPFPPPCPTVLHCMPCSKQTALFMAVFCSWERASPPRVLPGGSRCPSGGSKPDVEPPMRRLLRQGNHSRNGYQLITLHATLACLSPAPTISERGEVYQQRHQWFLLSGSVKGWEKAPTVKHS